MIGSHTVVWSMGEGNYKPNIVNHKQTKRRSFPKEQKFKLPRVVFVLICVTVRIDFSVLWMLGEYSILTSATSPRVVFAQVSLLPIFPLESNFDSNRNSLFLFYKTFPTLPPSHDLSISATVTAISWMRYLKKRTGSFALDDPKQRCLIGQCLTLTFPCLGS